MALLMGLVLLAAISLVAVTAANGMVLQRRLAGNAEEDARAAQDAQMAVATARDWLDSRADIERQAGCVSACLLPMAIRGPGSLPADPEFQSAAWWRSNGYSPCLHPETGEALPCRVNGAEPPRWLIEEIHYRPLGEQAHADDPRAAGYYRILGRGTGLRASHVAVVEAIVARPWEGDYEPGEFPRSGPRSGFCRQFAAAPPCGSQSWRRRR